MDQAEDRGMDRPSGRQSVGESDLAEVGHYFGPPVGVAGVRGIETESLNDVAVSGAKFIGNRFGLADDSERIQDLVVDKRSHLVPFALFGQCVQFVLEPTPTMHVEYWSIRGC